MSSLTQAFTFWFRRQKRIKMGKNELFCVFFATNTFLFQQKRQLNLLISFMTLS